MTPMEKAAIIDKHADAVRAKILNTLNDDEKWSEIVGVAKARHILGHYEYGDGNLFEWSDGKVKAAILEEFSDSVVYGSWLEERSARPHNPKTITVTPDPSLVERY